MPGTPSGMPGIRPLALESSIRNPRWRNLLRAVHTAGDEVGLNGDGREPVGLHDLRHSFVAVGFEKGLSAPEIAALARHANAKVTLGFYAGLSDGGREQAAAKLTEGGFGR